MPADGARSGDRRVPQGISPTPPPGPPGSPGVHLDPHVRINSLIHRLCTPRFAPCPKAACPLCGRPAVTAPCGPAGYPQPRRAGGAAFGEWPFRLPVGRRPRPRAGLTGGRSCAYRVPTQSFPGQSAARWRASWPGCRCDLVCGASCEQAHVPAEQPTPRQDAWVPAAHAHQGGPRGAGRPAPEGPGQGQRMTPAARVMAEVVCASRRIPDAPQR